MPKGFTNEQTQVAHDAVSAQRDKVDKLMERLVKERAKLDEVVALSVSTSPDKRTWYHDEGPLSLTQAMGAADLSAAQLDATMLRYRQRVKEQRSKSKRKRTTRSRPTVDRGPRDARPPGF